jgi:beta-galactosidase
MQALVGHWEVVVDGRVAQQGMLPPLDIPPGGSQVLSLPLLEPQLQPGQESLLTIRFALAEDTAWANAGHEIAWEQLPLPDKAPAAVPLLPDELPLLHLVQDESTVTISGPDFTIEFARATASLARVWTNSAAPAK